MRRTRICSFLLAALMLLSCVTTASRAVAEGYTEKGAYNPETHTYDTWYEDENGERATGWLTLDGEKYYLGEDGVRAVGWMTLDGSKYYLSPAAYTDGTRFVYDAESGESGYYFFDKDGKMQTGWQTVGNEKYYFGKDGKQVSGWQEIDGEKYYFDPYLNAGGFRGIYDADTGKTEYYYFDKDGKMQTGWQTVDGQKYYLGKDGKRLSGWQKIDGEKYYLFPAAAIGAQSLSDPETGVYAGYYFDEDGKMQTGFISVEETFWHGEEESTVTQTYYYGTDGKMQTGWLHIGGDTYYLNAAVQTGFLMIYNEETQNSDRYYFGTDGKMQTGLVRADGKTYGFGADGKGLREWQQIGSDWYYFDYYSEAETGIKHLGDAYYFFDADGVMRTGWNDAGDSWGWRLFSENGRMVESFAGMTSVYIPAKVSRLKVSAFAGIGRDFIICCDPGSYAEQFAIRNGFQYNNGQKQVAGYAIRTVGEKVKWVVDNYTTPDMSDLEKVRALHDWLINNAHYDTSYSSYSASGVLLNGSGVCASYADAYQLLLNAAGIENVYISGSADNGTGSGMVGHAWNMVKLGDSWYHVDTTWDDPTDLEHDVPIVSGWEGYDYFLISDAEMGQNHSWYSSLKADEGMAWQGEPGWQKIGGAWVYYDQDGVLTTGAAQIDGILYGFSGDGKLLADGWQKGSGKYYYVTGGGVLASNEWLSSYGCWYFLQENGTMATGWMEIDDGWYYFSEDGAMATGWLQAGDHWYLMKENGVMATGWVQAGGNWYLMKDDGAMATGWVLKDGKWYFLGEDGAMATGWLQQGEKQYFLDASGAMADGWTQIGGTWYYFAGGTMQTGWQLIDGNWYYFTGDGAMVTGWQQVSGTWYYFGTDGAMTTGWADFGGTWYYFSTNGAMVTGAAVIDGRTEIFAGTGEWQYTLNGN